MRGVGKRGGEGAGQSRTSPEAAESVMYVSQSLTYSVLDRNMNARDCTALIILLVS